ncbi:ATP-dependent DNA ligase [Caulobacter hibisci]|uniref:DNA ligase (ATP) n=1 Tax=Caulobacter hibisci TaxID=2035993 RepID=A0ABS0SZS3_9CAUL|nr:ATP-dependent DNA ligase [Caulobacter hibisci]MBI1684163.1 ATP-dependent DNA ligase [Caulobacter hibisci]
MTDLTAATAMEARSADRLPTDPGWWYEPKWDGFRCLAFRHGQSILLQAKSGKPLTRYFPEIVASLQALPEAHFVLDGELLIDTNGAFSFEALQMRLHPAASRIQRLARETPAVLAAFDLLQAPDGADLRALAHRKRHAALAAFVERHQSPRLSLTPGTADPSLAQTWLDEGKLEGVVAKRLDGPYAEGERAMIKVKRQRTADCVVGGFRYGKDSAWVGSLLLGLYDDAGRLNHVGFTSGLAAADKPALTARLEALAGGSGFTGEAPGGPSRWSTERSAQWTPLAPEIVVEVSFDHVSAGRFRHGTRLIRFRPDKAPAQCRMEQID